jgi:transcriptional regulator with XRE-family HTH domain
MQFSEWLKRENMTQADAADSCDVSRPFISMLVAGRRLPSVTTLQKIVALSGGEVSLDDFQRSATEC